MALPKLNLTNPIPAADRGMSQPGGILKSGASKLLISASLDAQGDVQGLITTDDSGNLASDGGRTFRQIAALEQRDKEFTEGIALALALEQPIFRPGQRVAVRIGWGNYDSANAISASIAGIIAEGTFGPGTTVSIDAGIAGGFTEDQFGARAGLTFGW